MVDFVEEKKKHFVQTIVFIRKEHRQKLKSEAALKNVPYYIYLDEILSNFLPK